MEAQVIPKNQPSNLTGLVQDLRGSFDKDPPEFFQTLCTNLTALKPKNSETTQIITYALIATAVVGTKSWPFWQRVRIMVYHYIRENEHSLDSLERNYKE